MDDNTKLLYAQNYKLNFGDHTLTTKAKIDNFEFLENIYYLKTYDQITRLEKDSSLFFETVPGATVHNFIQNDDELSFSLLGNGHTSITLQLEGETVYRILNNKNSLLGSGVANSSGKINFSLELDPLKETHCIIKKS